MGSDVYCGVFRMRNDVIFAVETTLMIVVIIIQIVILAIIIQMNSRQSQTKLSIDDIEKLESKRKCP